MMTKEFVYAQATGRFWLRDEDSADKATSFGRGYSGHPPYVNQTEAEALRSRGPIPRGSYKLVGPFNHSRLGPVVYFLDPKPGNAMHGRSGFFIHGDNSNGDQSASHGCIILSRAIRDKIAVERTRSLVVI